MKQCAGFPNSAGTRITVFALLRVQSRGSAATATEQMSINAVSIPTPNDFPKHLPRAQPNHSAPKARAVRLMAQTMVLRMLFRATSSRRRSPANAGLGGAHLRLGLFQRYPMVPLDEWQ